MSTQCPEESRVRAWLEQDPWEENDRLGEHLGGCLACQAARDQASTDHAAVDAALRSVASPPPTSAETELALNRLLARRDAAQQPSALPGAWRSTSPERNGTVPTGREPAATALTTPPTSPRRPRMTHALTFQRWRLALGGLAAALLLTLIVGTPEGRVAAAAFLAQFRSQRLSVVTFDPSQVRQTGLFRLEHLGTVSNPRPSQQVQVPSVQEAERRAGFPVLQPAPDTLPRDVASTPRVRYAPASETRMTFDREKVRTYFDSIGRKDLSLPDKLHGSTLVVSLPPIVMLEYPSADGKPALMIGQAREVQVGVEGNASLEEIRTFLLTLPNLPEDVARQLRSIQDWRSTLPIPVPVDKMSWQETKVSGASGFLLNDNTGLGSAVIWQKDGRILGAAGPMKAADLKHVAESLK